MKNKLLLTRNFPKEMDDYYSAPGDFIQHILPWRGRLHPHCTAALLWGLYEPSVNSDLYQGEKLKRFFPKCETCRAIKSPRSE